MLPIPDSLCHADVAPHNILVDRDHRCIFIDWAGAYLSHPFLPFEHLVARMKKERDFAAAWEPALREAYAAEWSLFASPDHIETAYRWTPGVAVLLYAVQRYEFYKPAYRLGKGGARLRGLLRTMWQMVKPNGKSTFHPVTGLQTGVPISLG
jgi:hypothetical protein